MNYYNEHDPFAAKWLRELIKAGHISQGEVDERSIEDARPDDLRGYKQCHFFAGIGVWSHALRTAGWPDDRPVWTGSCPCQPFSTAGKRQGFSDERHLWPTLYQLIRKCRPATFFGEQVASKDGLGWFDSVHSDLEDASYAVGAADLCAAGFGAPHIRQRLYFVADSCLTRTGRNSRATSGEKESLCSAGHPDGQLCGDASVIGSPIHELADSANVRCQQRGNTPSAEIQGQCTVRKGQHAQPGHEGQLQGRPEGLCGTGDGLANTPQQRLDGSGNSGTTGRGESSNNCELGHTVNSGLQGHGESGREPIQTEWQGTERHSSTSGFWSDSDWIACRDGKYRPVEPGTFPLAHGATNRVGRLRGYGNALVAPVATAFVEAFLEVEQGQ